MCHLVCQWPGHHYGHDVCQDKKQEVVIIPDGSTIYGGGGGFLSAKRCQENGYWDKEVTINSSRQHDFMNEDGSPKESKIAIGFKEIEEELVLNATNFRIIAEATKTTTSENWHGRSLKLRKVMVNYSGSTVPSIQVEVLPLPATSPEAAAA